MLNTIKSIVDTIFTNAEEKDLIARTSTSHKDASNIFSRTLNEITKIYRIEGMYDLDEQTNGNEIKFIFSKTSSEDSLLFRENFSSSIGSLVLVDEEMKRSINRNFRYNLNGSHFNSEDKISQCPDFIYEVDDKHVWVNLCEIRNVEEEQAHTENLQMLYQFLYQADKVTIDINFNEYSKCTDEKLYDLNHFRLDRNSLFLSIKDPDSNRIVSHSFEKIQSVACFDNSVSRKFWLYMDKGTYRFYIPYEKDRVEAAPIDPKLSEI